MIGVIFMFLMVVSFFFCGFFVTCRLDCNRCGGNFKRVRNSKKAQKQALYTILVLAVLYVGSSAMVSVFNYLSFKGIYDATQNFEREVSNLEISFSEITGTITSLVNSANRNLYTGLKVIENFNDVKKEIDEISRKSISFSNSAYAYEVVLFSWIWLQLFFALISMALVVFGSKQKKSNTTVVLGTVLLYVLLVTHLAYLACLSSEIFMVADICEQIYSVVTFNSVPNTELGLAYYFKPFSYEAIGNTLAQSYLVAAAYDSVMGIADKSINRTVGGCKDIKIFTVEDYENVFVNNKDCFITSETVDAYRDALQKLSVIVSQLFDMRHYRNLRKFSQDSEWPLCVRSLNSFAFLFYGMVACTFLILLITITATRMITVTNKKISEYVDDV
eukprot:TRINITY_DN4194_c0_g1_i2.p1 TRINITY_DN4194_c0_g1~~TRINITY_DN4194_c0_g1_i2.p1  ORF type:complete len:389 (+),score=88.22 TRINITY_DN4194_c0_g1_i2:239-1405(+)